MALELIVFLFHYRRDNHRNPRPFRYPIYCGSLQHAEKVLTTYQLEGKMLYGEIFLAGHIVGSFGDPSVKHDWEERRREMGLDKHDPAVQQLELRAKIRQYATVDQARKAYEEQQAQKPPSDSRPFSDYIQAGKFGVATPRTPTCDEYARRMCANARRRKHDDFDEVEDLWS
jgi:hypothetical protein